MSILIKGMEMPKDYKYVDVRIFRDGTATTASAEEPFYKEMDVVEVPTPHGDLIYREYAIAAACSGRIRTLPTTGDGEDWIRVKEVLESIKAAPTIIPAEEGE